MMFGGMRWPFDFMFAFSTCWNSHRHTDGREMLLEIRALGFEYAELGHGIRISLFDGILKAVSAGEIKISSLHNFCPLPIGVMGPAPDYYLPSSLRETERALAVRHTLRTIECAASVGAKAVVMHLGLVAMRFYTMKLLQLCSEGRIDTPKFQRIRAKALAVRDKKRQKYLDQVIRTLDAVLPRAKELGVTVGIETRFGIEEIPNEQETADLLQRFESTGLTYWHDVAHALIKEQLGLLRTEDILERFRGRTAGIHLQDFLPPVGDHLPPGQGSFNFERLKPFVQPETVLAWELHPRTSREMVVASVPRVHQLLAPQVSA